MDRTSLIALLIAAILTGIGLGVAMDSNPPCVPGAMVHCLSEPTANSFAYCRKSGLGYGKCHAIITYPDPYYPLGIE